MLQTIQEFAEEQLAASGEEAAVRDAHAAFYLGLATEAEPYLIGAEAISWLDRLDDDHDNLRAALAWLRQRDDATLAVQMAGALWRFWWLRGHLREGRAEVEAALDTGDAAATTAERAATLDGAGVLAETQGDYAQAEILHRQALAISRNLDDRAGIARALGNLGVIAFDRGDHEGARSLLEESLELARTLDDRNLVATALNDLGRVAYEQGEVRPAETLYQESLDLRRQLGSSSEIARALNNLGFVAFDLGDYDRARELFSESLERYRQSGDRWGTAAPLNGLAVSLLRGGDIPGAMALLEESLALFRETGDARNAAATLLNLGSAARAGGDHALAHAYYREALAGSQAAQDPGGVVDGLAGVAASMVQLGQPEDAVRLMAAVERHVDASDAGSPFARDPSLQAAREQARSTLGDDAFRSAWEAGQALTLEAAVAAVPGGTTAPGKSVTSTSPAATAASAPGSAESPR